MSRTLSPEEQKELGKRHYARKEYDKALDAFTSAIHASSLSDVQLHDYRAATFEKLGRMIEALADSRRMIRTSENDPRGYLRAGQLLVKMEKKEQALLIYRRGLQYVHASHPQRALLHEVHKRMNTEHSPPQAADPFTKLPGEIVGMVIEYLKFHELVSCLRVSKSWKQYLESLPSLWTTLDLLRIGSRHNVKAASVKRYIKLAQEKVVYARLAKFDNRAMLNQLLTVCKVLEKLELINCPFGSDSIWEAAVAGRQLKVLIVHSDIEVNGSVLFNILDLRRRLEEVRVHSCVYRSGHNTPNTSLPPQSESHLPNLKILDIRIIESLILRNSFFRTIYSGRAPNLVELRLKLQRASLPYLDRLPDDFSYATKLQRLELDSIFKDNMLRLPPSLKSLELRFSKSINRNNVERVKHDLTLLEHLHLHNHWGNLAEFLGPLEDAADLAGPGECTSSHSEALDPGVALPLSAPRRSIRTLTLGLAGPPTLDEFVDYISHPRLLSLEELSIGGCAGECLDDECAESLHQFRNLRRLTIDSAPITGVGLKGLVKALHGVLEQLELVACNQVGHDALEWIATQNIAVRVVEKRTWRMR